jgi:hypothetical protein
MDDMSYQATANIKTISAVYPSVRALKNTMGLVGNVDSRVACGTPCSQAQQRCAPQSGQKVTKETSGSFKASGSSYLSRCYQQGPNQGEHAFSHDPFVNASLSVGHCCFDYVLSLFFKCSIERLASSSKDRHEKHAKTSSKTSGTDHATDGFFGLLDLLSGVQGLH